MKKKKSGFIFCPDLKSNLNFDVIKVPDRTAKSASAKTLLPQPFRFFKTYCQKKYFGNENMRQEVKII